MPEASGPLELERSAKVAFGLVVVSGALAAWALAYIFMWIDGGAALYEFHPWPQVTLAAAALALLVLVPTHRQSRSRGFWPALICFCIVASLATSALVGELDADRREFFLLAHSVEKGDAAVDVWDKLGRFKAYEGDNPGDWIHFGMSPGPGCWVGLVVDLTPDGKAVANTRFVHD